MWFLSPSPSEYLLSQKMMDILLLTPDFYHRDGRDDGFAVAGCPHQPGGVLRGSQSNQVSTGSIPSSTEWGGGDLCRLCLEYYLILKKFRVTFLSTQI